MAAPLLTGALVAAFAWGQTPVTAVRFQPENVRTIADLREAFGVVEGTPLSREEIRRGVQALIASRAVEDVVVEAIERDGGVELVVTLQLASRVSSIAITGVSRRQRALMLADLGVTVGEPLTVSTFELGLERARSRLRERGFHTATLDPTLDFDVPGGGVDVSVAAALGRPLQLREIEAPGSELGPDELWRRTGLRAGDRADMTRLDRGRRELLESLRREGLWESEVDPPVVEVSEGGALVRFAVQRGACWTLDLQGLKRSKSLDEEALVFVRGEEPFSEPALDLTVSRVRTFLQREGRLLAQVTGEVSEAVPERQPCRALRLRVTGDARTPIVAVRFPGLRSLSDAELRERVGVRKGRPWVWGREGVDEDTLAADAESLLATLHDAGFALAEVKQPRLLPDDGGVVVEFPVEEGVRHVVRTLAVEGVPAGVKVPPLPLVAAGPWGVEAELRSRDTLLLALQDAGFADAQVASAHRCEQGECDVTITAQPGEAVRVARLVITGLSRTRRSVVEKVAALEAGKPLGPSEQIAVQRRLLALGVFQRAAVRPIPGQDAGPERGFILDLAEAPTRAFGFGLGWDTVEHLRVSASWSELNLFGRAAILSFQGRFSDRQRTVEVSYREPGRIGVIGYPTWTSIYRTEEHFPTYDLLRRGMWLQLGDLERRPRRTILRYDYQIVSNNAPDEILSELERDKQNLAIASITPIFEWDTRDDVFSPRRGTFVDTQLQVAFKAFLGDSSFEKLSLSLAEYRPLAGGVLAASVRGGVIWPRPFADGPCDISASPGGCDNLAIPISVRLFGGGRISQRAFETDRLGIPGKTLICPDGRSECLATELEPVGGAGLVLGSLEWRFPVFSVVGGSVFVDAGNVWASGADVRLAELRWGAGLGVRVETPVGPIRLEYGWKLDRKPGESPGELFLSLGNPF